MRSKFILVIAALIIVGLLNVNGVFAQTPSNTVTLNIKLQPIQTIVVNPSQNKVDVVYSTAENYKIGVSKELGDHLSVFSTGGFDVSVKSEKESFKRVGGSESLALSDMNIIASNGTKVNASEKFNSVTLSTDAKKLIESTKGGRDLQYKVTYNNTAGGNDEYINEYKYLATANTGRDAVFTTDITYTIIAK